MTYFSFPSFPHFSHRHSEKIFVILLTPKLLTPKLLPMTGIIPCHVEVEHWRIREIRLQTSFRL